MLPKICPRCGVVVNNLYKHKKRDRCRRQHIRKKTKEILKMTEPYKNFKTQNIPEPPPSDFPEESEEPDLDDEEYMIPTYRGEKKKDEDS